MFTSIHSEEPMSFAIRIRIDLLAMTLVAVGFPVATAYAQAVPAVQAGQTVRVVGVVRDETNAIALPGVPVEVVGTRQVVYTDVDGRYILELAPGTHQIKVLLDGYQERLINVEAGTERSLTVDVGLAMTGFAETVTVSAQAMDVQTSSAEAQLIERRNSQVITDNLGSQEMRQNGDSDAA